MPHDIGLIDGDLPRHAVLVTGPDLVAQRIAIRLRTFLGEWFFDRTAGLPYFTWFAAKPVRVGAIGAVLRRAVETTPGVRTVAAWAGAFAIPTRTLTYTATVIAIDGTEIALTASPLAGGNRAAYVLALVRGRSIIPA